MVNLKKSFKFTNNHNNKAETNNPACVLTVQFNDFFEKLLTEIPHKSRETPHFLLAFSGGLDSTVLLHLLAQAKSRYAFELHALHINHHLNVNADKWADFCAHSCFELNVSFQVKHVNLADDFSLGIEAAARQLRYKALFDYQIGVSTNQKVHPDAIITAHHQDDQAETLLLQLIRGAGVKGLASMPEANSVNRLYRPFLPLSRQIIHEYALHNNLTWCEDESNSNVHYERNFVRHALLPILEKRHPAIKSIIARTASHMAEANHLLDNLAIIDAENLIKKNQLCLAGLSALSEPRAKNLLRWWFSQNNLIMPNSDYLNEIIEQLFNAKLDAGIKIYLKTLNDAQHLVLRCFQKKVYLSQDQQLQATDLLWSGEPELMLPNGDLLKFNKMTGSGLALRPGLNTLKVTNRHGGERFQPNALRPTRSLKYLMQEAHIPPWERPFLPLIYWDAILAYVPDIGIAHHLQARENELGLVISLIKS